MPTYVLTSPEGKRYRVTGDGTGEEALAQLQAQLGAAPQAIKNEGPLPSRGRTVLEQGLQGATFNLSDEAMNRIGAGIASLATGEKYSDLLNEATKQTKERMAQQMEQRPVLSIGSNIGGALLTGGASATTKAGSAVANSLRAGSTAARIGKGALVGAASGGLYGAGAADEGSRIEGAKQGAVLGGLVGGAIPAVGAAVKSSIKGTGNVIKGATARSIEQLDDVSSAMRQSANQAYQAMRQSGAVINRPRAVNISNRVEQAIASSGKLNQSLHGNTLSVLDDFKQAVRSNDVTIEELDQFRQLFSDVVKKGTDVTGKIDPDAFKAVKAIEAIDDAVSNLGKIDIRGGSTAAIDALKAGRKEYAKARKFEMVADIIRKADNDGNVLKRELKKLADNPKKIRGFSPQELTALQDAARQTTGEGILKALGKFGFDLGGARGIGNTALPVIGSAVGAGASGGVGAVVAPTVGTAARMGQKAIARGKAETLLNVIEGAKNVPQVSKSVSPLLSAPAGGVAGGAAAIEAPIISQPIAQPIVRQSSVEQQQPQDMFNRIKMAESGGNPNAKAATSSASGLYQFTDQTWRDSVAKWGKKYGITDAMKNNPKAQEIMVRELAADNARILGSRLGREPNIADMYAAHFLGASDAVKLINNLGSNRPAFMIMPPKVVNANKSIFFDGKQPRTVEQVYALLGNKVA